MRAHAALAVVGEGLTKSYRRSRFVLDVPSIEAPAGSTLALLGPSGCGKTTLLRLLGLLEVPDSGRVLIGGVPGGPRSRDLRLEMAAVFQRPYLFKGSVGENVGFGLVVRRIAAAERGRRVREALERVGLGGFEGRSALALSGGEAQRVSLARALVLEPRVLLLDEPLASLDPLLKRQLTRDFASILHDSAVTVVYVTHDQDEALVVADHIAVMNEGRIVTFGSAQEVAAIAEDEWTAAFLGVEAAAEAVVLSSSDGLSVADANGVTLSVAGDLEPGAQILVSVRPEDVLLFESDAELPVTTARNRIHVRVRCVEPLGPSLRIGLDAGGMGLASTVSRAAAAELGLVPGKEVIAVFKATATRWRRVDGGASGIR